MASDEKVQSSLDEIMKANEKNFHLFMARFNKNVVKETMKMKYKDNLKVKNVQR